MPDHLNIEAVAFDYGNTLIEFNHEQIAACDRKLAAVLEERLGPADPDKMMAVRKRQRVAPYQGDPPEFIENDLAELAREMVLELYGIEAENDLINTILKVRFEAFIETVKVEDDLFELLDMLAGKYRLALMSNYPCGHAVRESLKHLGLSRYFETVVVSGDIGHVKPHPLPFSVLRDELMLDAGKILYVGDNWLADIQGARRAGMQAVFMTRWGNPEGFRPQPKDHQPYATIAHLRELLDLL